MNAPCPIKLDCPGTDFPITNYSSEGGEPLGPPYIGFDPNQPEKPQPGSAFWATGCIGECYSSVSQEEADLCAQTQQLLCDNVNPPPEPPDIPPGSYTPFYSAQKQCTALCGNGSSYVFTVASGVFVASTQAQADAMAAAYACQRAQQLRTCLSALTTCLCVGTVYSSTIVPSNTRNGSVLNWSVVGGGLPTGLVFSGGTLSGTPTVSGNYSFTVRAIFSNGNYSERTYTLDVISLAQDLAPTFALPNGSLGADYDYQVTALGMNTPFVFTLVGGGFPLGVDITSSGKITGVVGEEGLFNPVIRVTDTNGCFCEQALTFDCTHVTDVFAYFNCDETGGSGIIDIKSLITLNKSTLAFPTETGFIGTSVRTGAYPSDPFFKASNFYTPLADASHWDFSTTSWTIRMWVNIINGTQDVWLASALSTPDQFRILWLSTGNVELTALLGGGWETITVPMTSGGWHRIIAYYEKGVGIGLMVDDGLPILGVNTNLIGAGNQRLLIGGPLGYGVPPTSYGNIDEVAIWKRLLTADEITYDWNSGLGRTYPDIP